MAFYQFKSYQEFNTGLEEMWSFLSSPHNLSGLTPADMGLVVKTTGIPEKMHAGMILAYSVTPFLGFKTTWVTEITHVEENKYFVDEQRCGPFTMWHHQHRLTPVAGGVRMEDIVSYVPPLGLLGVIANSFFIRRQLIKIFDFRRKALEKKFGKFKSV